MKNEKGICWIWFEEGVKEEEITKIISDFFVNNAKKIKGMTYDHLREDFDLTELQKEIQKRLENEE